MKGGRPKCKRVHIRNLKLMLEVRGLSLNKAANLLAINRQTLTNWIQLGVPEHELHKVKELVSK